MKTLNIKSIIVVVLASLAISTTTAQNQLHSSYFTEGSNFRHQLNPAFAPNRGYFSMPILGNMNIGLQSTIGVSNFIYKTENGGLTTFMNSSVNADEFLGDLKDRNRINMNLDMNILSFGFRAFKGYNTFTVNLRNNIRMNLPKDLFAFMKQGMSSERTVYELDNMGLSMTSFAEVGLGHTHRINDKWVVGGKLKILLGLAKADMKIDHMKMTMAEDEWAIEGDGEMNVAVKGLEIPSKAEAGEELDKPDAGNQIAWDEMDFDSFGLSGGGAAIDLGVTWKVREDLELSAAILDFGFIKWNNNTSARMGMEPWSFKGFNDIAVNPDEDSKNQYELEDQLEDMGDDLEECVNFSKVGEAGSRTTMLGATLNLGAQYTLPQYKGLRFGFLSSTYINGAYSWSEGRFSANLTPCKWFDASINYAISSFGSSFGWLISIHPKGFGLFIGSDHQFFKVTPQFVPVHHATANFNFGISFPLGKYKRI